MGPWWWSSGQRARLYSDDPSSNHAEVYIFYSDNCLKRTKINRKRPGMAHFFKKNKKDSQLGRGGGGGGQVDSVLAFYSDNLEFESC